MGERRQIYEQVTELIQRSGPVHDPVGDSSGRAVDLWTGPRLGTAVTLVPSPRAAGPPGSARETAHTTVGTDLSRRHQEHGPHPQSTALITVTTQTLSAHLVCLGHTRKDTFR